jgi:hypothetical protein
MKKTDFSGLALVLVMLVFFGVLLIPFNKSLGLVIMIFAAVVYVIASFAVKSDSGG